MVRIVVAAHYVGGKTRRGVPGAVRITHTDHGAKVKAKTVVMGLRERGGRVRAFVVPDNRRMTLMPRIREHVEPGTRLYTDALRSYGSAREDFDHFVIDHAKRYVDGKVHTNNVENSWSVLKRTLGGTYICPSAKHLDAYLDEQVYRFNERENGDGPRFAKATKGTDGKLLAYKALTQKL